MKRPLDVFLSFIGLIVLLPFFAVVAILIKLNSPGPVFFIQERIGRNFTPFKLYKFRTMVTDAPQKGIPVTVGGDPRITSVGRYLRRSKMDELPQLINVLKGDMSLVGPRPEVGKYVEMYRHEYNSILAIRPGITDISSLKYRNEEQVLSDKKDPEDYYIRALLPEKISLAKEYMSHTSLTYDLKLVLRTILRLFT